MQTTMKNQIKHILILISGSILLSSCSTTLFINRPLPPEIELGQDGQKIVIQNFFDYTLPEYVKEKHSVIYKDGIEAFSNSFTNYLGGGDFVFAEIGDSLVKSEEGRFLSDVLDSAYVEYTCNQFDADMLLAIDSLNIYFDFETEGTPIIFGGEGVVKHFYLLYIPYLSLYDWDGTLVDRRSVDMIHHYTSRESITAFITIKPSLKNAYEEALILGSEAGSEYGAKFFNTIGTFPYKVYIGNQFKSSYHMMLKNQWADAIRYLLPLAESGDSKFARKAAHNLWVAYEGFGDEANAEKWYQKSLEY